MSTQPQYKGPRKYEHGRDSEFILSALSANGKWTTIYSRSRPGSRANKVFTNEQQVQHLRNGFTDKSKGFDMFDGDFIFAYISHNQPDSNWAKAEYHWRPDTGWKSGPPSHHPAVSPTQVWQFGPNGSTLFLHVRNAAGWLPKIWGWDRPGNNSLITFPLQEQIARLKGQFAVGGHEKCRFNPDEVVQAFIAYRETGSVRDSLCWYSPDAGWQQGSKPYEGSPKAIEPDTLPVMTGKLWVTGPSIKAETIYPNNFLRIQFQRFCQEFAELWPTAVEQYCDRETGEIPVMAMEAFFWANEARIKKANTPNISIARIYFTGKSDYLIPRMDTGRIYHPQSFSWPSLDYFR